MDIEAQLRKLEARYRAASSAATAAKAHYLGVSSGEKSAAPEVIQRARESWRRLEERRRTIAALMGEIEEMDSGATG